MKEKFILQIGLVASLSLGSCGSSSYLTEKNENIACTYNIKARNFQLQDLRTGQVWKSDTIVGGLKIIKASKVRHAIQLELCDTLTLSKYQAQVTLENKSGIKFAIAPMGKDVWSERIAQWPPTFTTNQIGELLITDRSSGLLINQKDPVYSNKIFNVYTAWPRGLSLPFTGVVYPSGAGLMMLFGTPADAALKIEKKNDNVHYPCVLWRQSMQRMNYPREVTYTLFDKGGYVSMAKSYRQMLIDSGHFKTLEQKAKERPNVNKLKGAPSIWGWPYNHRFHEEAYNYGVSRALLSVDWQYTIPKEYVEVMKKNGWLPGKYDQFTDILKNIETDALRPSPKAGPKKAWRTLEGLQYYSRSSALMADVAEKDINKYVTNHGFTQFFIDVASCIDLYEDYHPNHTYDRRQDMLNRQNIYKKFNDHQLVTRGEFGNAWVAEYVDELSGAMSSNNFISWPAGHLKLPKPGQISQRYRKYGMGYDIKIPLWQLVFHDCLIDTWYWGDTAGFVYEEAPDLATRKDLFNILYGTIPLLWFDDKGYGWDRHRERFMQTYQTTCKLHEAIAFDEMLDHQYLSSDRSLQKTIFSSGANVIVNFANKPQPYSYDGKNVILAGEGYFLHGVDMTQSRLLENGNMVTRIHRPGYYFLDTEGTSAKEGPILFNGRISAFSLNKNRWNIFLTSGKYYEIDLCSLTGWPEQTHFKISLMNDRGDLVKTLSLPLEKGILKINATEGHTMLSITR